MSRRRLAIVAAASLVALAAGVAYAAIPDSGGVFHACVDKQGGVRIIDHDAGQGCDVKEQHVHFNEQGQKGDKGDQGEPGSQGPEGPPGPAATVEGFAAVNLIHTTGPGLSQLVVEKAVPAGSYVLTAVIDGFVHGPPPKPARAHLSCTLRKREEFEFLAQGATTVFDDNAFPDQDFAGNGQIALTAAYSADEATAPQVRCVHGFGSETILTAHLTIVKLSSLG